MKRFFLILIIIFFSLPIAVMADDDERVRDFKAVIKINEDSSIEVKEQITYVFGENERHGIYRDIPYKYNARGGKYKLRLENISVTDTDENPIEFKVSNKGDYKNIRIGSPNEYVSGTKTYVINYKVKRALNYFEDHDELYWNATGDEWPVEISQSRITVLFPLAVQEKDIQTDCFVGKVNSTDKCVSTRYEFKENKLVKSVVYTNDKLKVNEGVTVLLGWPKGFVEKPSKMEEIIFIAKDNFILGLPILILILFVYLWRAKGKDPKGRETIIAYYEAPNKLAPAEIGTIIDEKAHNHDISSEIIYLAINGYLKIKRLEKKGVFEKDDYELLQLKSEYKDLKAYQGDIMKALFKEDSIKLSDLKTNPQFYKDLGGVIDDIYKATVANKYFVKNPKKVRAAYLALGIFILLAGFFVIPFWGVIGLLSLIFSGIIIIVFSFIMPKRTKEGVVVREKILGLKEYLRVAEKDRIKFHNAPEKDPEQFEKLLPFAMVLGIEEEWAKQFKDIYDQQPNWYEDYSHNKFNSINLASSLNNFSNNTYSSITSSRAAGASSGSSGFSSGGGFSGGGFGGGGGGSW